MEDNILGENLLDNRNREELDLSILDEEIVEEVEPKEEIVKKQETKDETKSQEDKIDYKEKYVESTREASTLYFKNQKLNKTIEEASEIKDPTIDELKSYAKSRGADYDELDEFSQNILKDTYINNKRFEKIQSVARESRDIDNWATQVDGFIEKSIDNGNYPSLNSLGNDFKKFAMKESRRGLDLDDLVASFLFSAERNIKKPNNESILLTGSNSTITNNKTTGLTEQQISVIRETNPKEYRRLIKSGEINLEI